MAAAAGALLSAHPSYGQVVDTEKTPILLEVINGETAFVVDPERYEAGWIVGQCQRDIPLDSAKQSSQEVMTSLKTSDEVTLGLRQVVLEQQFRFNLTTTPVTVEVFNSVRGGWSDVPVRENASCHLQAACKKRMESPDC